MNHTKKTLSINEITEVIIGSAIPVHTSLGPGLLEPVHQECLFYELTSNSFKVEKEKPLPLDVHIAQVLTYPKLSNNKIGLLSHFNGSRIKNGLKRLINKFYQPQISLRSNK